MSRPELQAAAKIANKRTVDLSTRKHVEDGGGDCQGTGKVIALGTGKVNATCLVDNHAWASFPFFELPPGARLLGLR